MEKDFIQGTTAGEKKRATESRGRIDRTDTGEGNTGGS